MPIYSYSCAVCSHEEDVLQKISDPVLTICPNCREEAFVRKITAAQFHLKGSGWYVTDFRGTEEKKKSEGSLEKNKSPAEKNVSPKSEIKKNSDSDINKNLALKSNKKEGS